MTQFVDWDLAASTAALLGGAGPRVSYAEAAEVVTELHTLAAEAGGHVERFTGLLSPAGLPPAVVVDRADWAAANIEGLSALLESLAPKLVSRQPGSLTTLVGGKVTGAQAGTMLAYLSTKVLGQYEVFAADPGRLLLVAPNIVEVGHKLGADGRDFRLWVCLHEVAHQTQFTAVPWLRAHFLSEIGAFADASQHDGEALTERIRRAFAALTDEKTNLLDIMQNQEQRKIITRLTALMTLLEGHAEFVMDGVGPSVVPTVADIRAKFARRRENPGHPLERLLRRLLGVEAKMSQYRDGRRFVEAVVGQVGMADFNKVFTSPETLPLMEEFTDPPAWISRVL